MGGASPSLTNQITRSFPGQTVLSNHSSFYSTEPDSSGAIKVATSWYCKRESILESGFSAPIFYSKPVRLNLIRVLSCVGLTLFMYYENTCKTLF